MAARPWYLSFTAVWNSASHGFGELGTKCDGFVEVRPFHHTPVRREYWHFTVLPLLKVTTLPDGVEAEEFALELLAQVGAFANPIRVGTGPLRVKAYELKVFDSGTCVQFNSDDGSLSALRDSLRELYRNVVNELIAENGGFCTELEPRNAKNSGNTSWGSIARSLTPDGNSVRWRILIDPPIEIVFDRIYLLVSDEFLSNPAAHDEGRRFSVALG